jgi:hypothetical protein
VKFVEVIIKSMRYPHKTLSSVLLLASSVNRMIIGELITYETEPFSSHPIDSDILLPETYGEYDEISNVDLVPLESCRWLRYRCGM